jgi:hypothetical protein
MAKAEPDSVKMAAVDHEGEWCYIVASVEDTAVFLEDKVLCCHRDGESGEARYMILHLCSLTTEGCSQSVQRTV